mgnify:CR=1 FL=1
MSTPKLPLAVKRTTVTVPVGVSAEVLCPAVKGSGWKKIKTSKESIFTVGDIVIDPKNVFGLPLEMEGDHYVIFRQGFFLKVHSTLVKREVSI